MKSRAWIGALLVAIVAGASGLLVYQRWQLQNMPLPDLSLTDLDGKAHKLAEFRGKVTLVNFWASWCGPCLNEMPLLVKAQARLSDHGLQIVGPAMDARPAVVDIVRKFGVNYPIFVGEEEVDAAMTALGDDAGVLPYSVLIGADGKVQERIAGGLSQTRLDALLAKYIGP